MVAKAAAFFENMAYFNFDGNAGLQSVFEYDFDVKRIVDELGSIIYGDTIEPGRTLVVFDEIQETARVQYSHLSISARICQSCIL